MRLPAEKSPDVVTPIEAVLLLRTPCPLMPVVLMVMPCGASTPSSGTVPELVIWAVFEAKMSSGDPTVAPETFTVPELPRSPAFAGRSLPEMSRPAASMTSPFSMLPELAAWNPSVPPTSIVIASFLDTATR